MNANPFIKPEVGQQAHTYISQYVPLPFEMMQKKADSMQKVLDSNKMAAGTLQGMMKVNTILPEEKQIVDQRLGDYEKEMRDISQISNPSEQSARIADLTGRLHEDLTRGDLAHFQAQYDKMYGKGAYSDQADEYAKQYGAGTLSQQFKAKTIENYRKQFDPKNPTKTQLNPYPMNKPVWLEKEIQPLAGQIQREINEKVGPTGSLTMDGITGNFIRTVGNKTEVIPNTKISEIVKGLIRTNPEIQSHLNYNVEGIYGNDERRYLESLAVANLMGINVVNNRKDTESLDRYTNPVGADGKPPKDPNDLNPSFTTPYVRTPSNKEFLNDPNEDQLELYGAVRANSVQNMKVSFTTSYKSTLGGKSQPSAAAVESSILKTLQNAGLAKGATSLTPELQENFMRGIADGSIKSIVDARGVDVYKNNKPMFIELKRQAEMHVNKIEMADLQFQQAMKNLGIPDEQKPLIKLAARAKDDAIRAETVFKANIEKIKNDASWTKFIRFKPGMGSLSESVEDMDLSTVTTILDSYGDTLKKFPTVKKSLERLKESRAAEEKVKSNMTRLGRELKVMAEGKHTAQESLLTTIKVTNPKGGEPIKVNFSDAMSDIIKAHQGSFSGMIGVASNGQEMSFNDFINSAVTKMPGYAGEDEKGRAAMTKQFINTLATGSKLSGTKDVDGNHQVVFEYGGETLHIPVTFGATPAPEKGFKINKSLDPAYSSMINTETTVNDALTNKMDYTPLGLMSNGVRLETNTGVSLLDVQGDIVPDGAVVKIDRGSYGGKANTFFVVPKSLVPSFVHDYNVILENKGSQAAKAWTQTFLEQNGGL